MGGVYIHIMCIYKIYILCKNPYIYSSDLDRSAASVHK